MSSKILGQHRFFGSRKKLREVEFSLRSRETNCNNGKEILLDCNQRDARRVLIYRYSEK